VTPKPLMTPQERRIAGIHRRAMRTLKGTDEEAKAQAKIDLKESRVGLASFWSKLAKWKKENPDAE
jgi:hypothetical protein